MKAASKTPPAGVKRNRKPGASKAPAQRLELGEYVVADPLVCHGKLTYKGTRIMVWPGREHPPFSTPSDFPQPRPAVGQGPSGPSRWRGVLPGGTSKPRISDLARRAGLIV